jgi:hypothetical protein
MFVITKYKNDKQYSQRNIFNIDDTDKLVSSQIRAMNMPKYISVKVYGFTPYLKRIQFSDLDNTVIEIERY